MHWEEILKILKQTEGLDTQIVPALIETKMTSDQNVALAQQQMANYKQQLNGASSLKDEISKLTVANNELKASLSQERELLAQERQRLAQERQIADIEQIALKENYNVEALHSLSSSGQLPNLQVVDGRLTITQDNKQVTIDTFIKGSWLQQALEKKSENEIAEPTQQNDLPLTPKVPTGKTDSITANSFDYAALRNQLTANLPSK